MSDEAMVPIPVTQYMRPNGRISEITMKRPTEIAELAQAIIAKGLRFEAEVLMTDEVSLTIYDPIEAVDLFIEITPNGPEVLEAFDRLVLSAAAQIVDSLVEEVP